MQDVGSSYDAVGELFEYMACFVTRLRVYTTLQPTPLMQDAITKILVELISVLGVSTKQVKQGVFSSLVLFTNSRNAHDPRQKNTPENYFRRKMLKMYCGDWMGSWSMKIVLGAPKSSGWYTSFYAV